MALEETWKTNRWALRVFQFLLAVSEVNAKLVNESCFGQEQQPIIDFRKRLVDELINNRYLEQESRRKLQRKAEKDKPTHKLVRLPVYRTFGNSGKIVSCRTKYIQLKCYCGRSRVRKYCICSPGILRCDYCFFEHRMWVKKTKKAEA